MAESNGFSSGAFQDIIGVCFVTFAVFQLISVPVISLIGLRRSSSLSCICIGVACILLCMTNATHMFVLIFVSVFAVNSIGSNATRVALRQATSHRRFKRIFAWASGGVQITQMFMPFVTGVLIAFWGWRWAVIVLAIPVVIAGVWIELAGKASSPDFATDSGNMKITGWKQLATRPGFIFPVLTVAFFQVAFSPVSAKLPFLLYGEAGLSAEMVGLALSASHVMLALSCFSSGYLVSYWSSIRLAATGVVILAAGLLLMILGRFGNIYHAIIGIMLVNAAYGFIVVPFSSDAMSAFGEHRAKASGFLGFMQPVTGGCAVLMAATLGTSDIDGAIT